MRERIGNNNPAFFASAKTIYSQDRLQVGVIFMPAVKMTAKEKGGEKDGKAREKSGASTIC